MFPNESPLERWTKRKNQKGPWCITSRFSEIWVHVCSLNIGFFHQFEFESHIFCVLNLQSKTGKMSDGSLAPPSLGLPSCYRARCESASALRIEGWARLGLGTLSFLLIPSILGVHIKICWCSSKFNQLQYENWDHPMANSGIETTSTGLLQANSMYLSSTETWSAKLEMRERHNWDNGRIWKNGIQHKPTKIKNIKIIGQGYAYPTSIGRISQ